MKYTISPLLRKQLKHIRKKNQNLFKKIDKQLHFFQENELHPSLRNHKLKGNLSSTWSITIEENIRMLYIIEHVEENRVAAFFAIGTHDEVYE